MRNVTPKIVLEWIVADLVMLVVGALLSIVFLVVSLTGLVWRALGWMRHALVEKYSHWHPAPLKH